MVDFIIPQYISFDGDDEMKNILLILTGGTIGSVNRNGIIGTDSKKCRVLEMYEAEHNDCRFLIRSPLNILSENLDVSHWEALINYILSLDLSGFDGMIITHGSDTLSYSSALLGMCLNHINIPIVITAANFVPDDPRSNALMNFNAAVRLIENVCSGIYTVYGSGTENGVEAYIPTRINEADRINDRFSSADGEPLAFIDKDGKIKSNTDFDMSLLEKHKTLTGLKGVEFRKSVYMITPYPSLDYDKIVIDENTGAVLHLTYHSATVSQKALTLLDRCRDRGIPMYMCSFQSSAGSMYETSDIMLKNGALPLYDLNKESAYAKLLLAVNLYSDDIEKFMNKNIYYEGVGDIDEIRS